MADLITTVQAMAERFGAAPLPLVWGYVRVSDATHEDGESPAGQEKAIRDYCTALRLDEPTIIYEKASAGKPLFAVHLPGMRAAEAQQTNPRPLLTALLAHACENSPRAAKTTIVIWKLDRLTRVASEQEMFFALLKRYGVGLHSAYPGESHLMENDTDADDPVKTLMRQILGCFAQYERQLIQLRMKMGSRMKSARGGWVGGGLPFGYDMQESDLVINWADAELVRQIFSLRYANSMPYSAIAERLNTTGSSGWYKQKIMRVLGNEKLYRGTLTDPYGQQHARPDLRILLDPDESIPGAEEVTLTSFVDTDEQVPTYGNDD